MLYNDFRYPNTKGLLGAVRQTRAARRGRPRKQTPVADAGRCGRSEKEHRTTRALAGGCFGGHTPSDKCIDDGNDNGGDGYRGTTEPAQQNETYQQQYE